MPEEIDLEKLMDKLDGRYVNKDVCAAAQKHLDDMANFMKETPKEINQLRLDTLEAISQIKSSLAKGDEWMISHKAAHTGGWNKAHTIAVVGSSIIAAAALIVSCIAIIIDKM